MIFNIDRLFTKNVPNSNKERSTIFINAEDEKPYLKTQEGRLKLLQTDLKTINGEELSGEGDILVTSPNAKEILKQSTPPTNLDALWLDTRRNELFKWDASRSAWLSIGSEEVITFITPQSVPPNGYFELAPGTIEHLVLEDSMATVMTCDKATSVDATLAIESDNNGAVGTFTITTSTNLEGGIVATPALIEAGSVIKLRHVGVVNIADTYIRLTLKKLAQ